eukprot:COSAG02_NODE_34818_length_478_cov_0.519789_1_plen_35_part_10
MCAGVARVGFLSGFPFAAAKAGSTMTVVCTEYIDV